MPQATTPNFVLFTQVDRQRSTGHWRFSLQSKDGSTRFEAADREPEARGERLELLTIVRGLEALDQPSRVTVCSAGTYVQRGVRYGLEEWQASDWMWERYGEWVPIKNADLWQRLDRVLQFHRVEFRRYRIDRAQNVAKSVVKQRIDGRRKASVQGSHHRPKLSNYGDLRPIRRSSDDHREYKRHETNSVATSTSVESNGPQSWLSALGKALAKNR